MTHPKCRYRKQSNTEKSGVSYCTWKPTFSTRYVGFHAIILDPGPVESPPPNCLEHSVGGGIQSHL